MNPTPMTSPLDKITLRDWLLALTSLLFTLGSLVIMWSDFKVGLSTLAIFGPCLALFVHIIRRKLRVQKQSTLTAAVVGGQPIRPAKSRIALLGAGFLVVGSILAIFQPDDDRIILPIALFIATTGAVVLVGLATGLTSRAFLQFDPLGLTMGYFGGRAIVPWSAIAEVARGEINNNQAVFLWVDPAAVSAEPPSYQARLVKQMASTQRWLGADFVIISSSYGIDAPILLAAIQRYVTLPEARAELGGVPAPGARIGI